MSCLRLIGRLIALFIIFIFVTVTPPLILAYNVQETIVSGDFLDKLFDDTDLFEAAIPEMAEDLAREIKQETDTRDLSIAELDADDWEQIIYAVAPPEAMQKWSQDALDGFRQWVRHGGRFLDDVIIPFGDMRDNIVNDPELTVLRTLTKALPECNSGQEPLDGPQNLVPDCSPPTSQLKTFVRRLGRRWHEQPREVWQQLFPDKIARYPDNISLADFIEQESGEDVWEMRAGWRATRWGFRVARWLLAAFIAAQCVVALGIVALFAARNWREALRWVGTPLALVGLFTLLLALFFFAGAEVGPQFIPHDEVPIGVEKVIEDTARAFANELWLPMSWQGGVLVLIGLGMWVLSFFAPVRYEPPPAPVAVAPAVPPVSEAVAEVTPTGEPEESVAVTSEKPLPTRET